MDPSCAWLQNQEDGQNQSPNPLVAEKDRLPGLTTEKFFPRSKAAQHSGNYALTSLAPEIVVTSHAYTVIPDILDRLIVAETLVRGLPLFTRDPVIRQAQVVKTSGNPDRALHAIP